MVLSQTRKPGGPAMPRAWRLILELIYRGGVIPWDAASGPPIPGLRDLVEGPARLTPGRAIDLGCGTGRNSVYLARQGWDVTAVEVIPAALAAARRRAEAAGVKVRPLLADVTRLDARTAGGRFTLLLDSACYHMLGADRRPAYSASVTKLAAPGALLHMVGWIRALGASLNSGELRATFPEWELIRAEPVPVAEIAGYIGWSALLRRPLEKKKLVAWCYQLRRRDDGGR